jgi:NADPH-dependent ferric siderophore reductase
MLTLAVVAREQISPHFVCITLGGDDASHLEQSGYDQWGRLFFPAAGQQEIAIPRGANWRLQIVSGALRPRIRSYSIRRFGPEIAGFDVEVAVHESTPDGRIAPGSNWALTARVGDRVGFFDEGHSYSPTAGSTWQLLVGDESAVPAILAILERTAADLPAEAFLEIPANEDIRDDIVTREGTIIHWLPRNDPSMKPGTLALQAVKDAQLRSGRFYTWAAGESALATGIRRHLVGSHRIPKSDISFTGYWRHGQASLG